MITLGVETSSDLCSVAWVEDGRIRMEYNTESPNLHATVLPNLVYRGFKQIGVSPTEVDLVAVSSGPGSFTGLRIGMSYALGFCYALSKPIVAISNFAVLAAQSMKNKYPLYTVIDARRGYYYLALFNQSSEHFTEVKRISGQELLNKIGKNSIIVSATKNLPGDKGDTLNVIEGKFNASILAGLAARKFQHQGEDGINNLEPLYLQQFAGKD